MYTNCDLWEKHILFYLGHKIVLREKKIVLRVDIQAWSEGLIRE